jgi:hypothetical protein
VQHRFHILQHGKGHYFKEKIDKLERKENLSLTPYLYASTYLFPISVPQCLAVYLLTLSCHHTYLSVP